MLSGARSLHRQLLMWLLLPQLVLWMAGAYFTFAAVQGDYGMFARVAINAEAASLRLERDKLSADLGEMQNLTHRLSDDYLACGRSRA